MIHLYPSEGSAAICDAISEHLKAQGCSENEDVRKVDSLEAEISKMLPA